LLHPSLLAGLHLPDMHDSSLQTGLGLSPVSDNISPGLAKSCVSPKSLNQVLAADASPRSIHMQCTYSKGNLAFIRSVPSSSTNYPQKRSPKSCSLGPSSSNINQGHPCCLPSAAQLYTAERSFPLNHL